MTDDSVSEYTPTTEEVRDFVKAADRVVAGMTSGSAVEAFDRWLATASEDWKAVANSADALLRAVMDELGIRPDQDPVIEARRIATEVRTGVVAEGPEIEWAANYPFVMGDGIGPWETRIRDEEGARAEVAFVNKRAERHDFTPLGQVLRREVRRGPWEPVKQEGAPGD